MDAETSGSVSFSFLEIEPHPLGKEPRVSEFSVLGFESDSVFDETSFVF